MPEHAAEASGARPAPAHSTANATFNLGALYADQGDVRRARELFEEARSRGHAGAANSLGELHERQGDVDRARGLYEEARGKGDVGAALNLFLLGGMGES